MIHILLFIFIILIHGMSFASDFQKQPVPIYPYQSSIILQDDFLSGTVTSGSLGTLGWNASNGSNSYIASETNHPGILRRDTSSASGTVATLQLYQGSSNAISGALPRTYIFVVRLNNNDANTTLRVGDANSVLGNPPSDGMYLEKLDADTNWFCITRTGSTQTRTDSGVAVNTSFNTFMFNRSSTGVIFTINNAVACTHTTNVSSAGINPMMQGINSVAASKTYDIDYFQIVYTGLAR